MLGTHEEYGQCPKCTRAFVVSTYSKYPTCNYDGGILKKVGKEYPSGVMMVGDGKRA
jgi:hypothetical protein